MAHIELLNRPWNQGRVSEFKSDIVCCDNLNMQTELLLVMQLISSTLAHSACLATKWEYLQQEYLLHFRQKRLYNTRLPKGFLHYFINWVAIVYTRRTTLGVLRGCNRHNWQLGKWRSQFLKLKREKMCVFKRKASHYLACGVMSLVCIEIQDKGLSSHSQRHTKDNYFGLLISL